MEIVDGQTVRVISASILSNTVFICPRQQLVLVLLCKRLLTNTANERKNVQLDTNVATKSERTKC